MGLTQQLSYRHLARISVLATWLVCLGSSRSAAATEDPWWGPDKATHFLASATISSGAYALGTVARDSKLPTVGLALSVTIASGASKEAWDAMGHGNASWKDFAWDIFGAIAGIGLSFAVDTAVRPAPVTR